MVTLHQRQGEEVKAVRTGDTCRGLSEETALAVLGKHETMRLSI